MDTNFFHRLKSARSACKLRAKELADAVGISTGYMSQLEGGARTMPSADLVAKLASTLGVSVEWLLTGKSECGTDHVAERPVGEYTPPEKDLLTRSTQEHLIWLEDQLTACRQNETRLLQIVETLSTLIAGPRPSEQGRSPEADHSASAAPAASGVLYKTRGSKTA